MTTTRWIRVRRYVDDPTASAEARLMALMQHHTAETAFLIDFIRSIIVNIEPDEIG